VDDIIWGTSAQRGKQGADLGRMAALDAGYDVRASGVTLDRFCGSGITAVNLAAAQIMSGMEELVIGGGTEMMSYSTSSAPPRDPNEGPMLLDSGNLRLRARHPQSNQGICADAIATMERGFRARRWTSSLCSASSAPTTPSATALRQVADAGLPRGRLGRPRPRGVSAAADHDGGPLALKPSFEAMANVPLDDKGTTLAGLINQVYSDLKIRHFHHAGTPRASWTALGRCCSPPRAMPPDTVSRPAPGWWPWPTSATARP